jgi:DNA-binding transcriptional regulator LsrR (DeoR family)
MSQSNDDLQIKAAWLYYIHGFSQEEVARHLRTSRSKVARMLSSARERGAVKISIEHETTETLALCDWIASTYGVKECLLTPYVGIESPDLALTARLGKQAVGIVAANHVGRRLQNGERMTVGIGAGKTLAEMVVSFPSMAKSELRVVSLLGASSHDDGNGCYSLALRFAAATGGSALTLPVPLTVSDPETRRALERDRSVRDTLEVARSAPIKVLGCGDCSPGNTFFGAARLEAEDVTELVASGAVCEIGGSFLDRHGRLAPTRLNERTLGVGLEALRRTEVIVLAAGRHKVGPLRAVLEAGLADVIVIDNEIAGELVNRPQA